MTIIPQRRPGREVARPTDLASKRPAVTLTWESEQRTIMSGRYVKRNPMSPIRIALAWCGMGMTLIASIGGIGFLYGIGVIGSYAVLWTVFALTALMGIITLIILIISRITNPEVWRR